MEGRPGSFFLALGFRFGGFDLALIFGFTENQDFRSFLSESTGGRPSKEYTLSMDMAKELSMVERTDKGKQARQYFIAVGDSKFAFTYFRLCGFRLHRAGARAR